MQNSFFQAICRMGIFMICAQAMIHFRPKEAYEKYLKLLVSVMVLIQIFLPIGNFLLGKGREEAAKALEQFRQDLEQSMAEAEENAAAADALLEKMTLEEVRSRLESQEEGQAGENLDGASLEEGLSGESSDGAWSGEGLSEGGSGSDWSGKARSEENPDARRESGSEEEETGVDIVEPIVIEVTIPKAELAD